MYYCTHPSKLCWRKPLSDNGCVDEEHRLTVSVSLNTKKTKKEKEKHWQHYKHRTRTRGTW